ncbi:diaphanous 1, putative [Babesia caballi]|uniref:Diaphanous 1, putative n=1 Tax=Babesia caballi TaxID=5871 RepID=A0AAV4LYA8_BABCB|nr:diaphanous 1, putative [Babesia caballi]
MLGCTPTPSVEPVGVVCEKYSTHASWYCLLRGEAEVLQQLAQRCRLEVLEGAAVHLARGGRRQAAEDGAAAEGRVADAAALLAVHVADAVHVLLLEVGGVVPQVTVEANVVLQAHAAALEEHPQLPARAVLDVAALAVVLEDAAHAGGEGALEDAVDVAQVERVAAAGGEGAARKVDGKVGLGEDAHEPGEALVDERSGGVDVARLVELAQRAHHLVAEPRGAELVEGSVGNVGPSVPDDDLAVAYEVDCVRVEWCLEEVGQYGRALTM